MRQRVLTSLMVLTAVLVSVLLATMPVIGQSSAPKAKKAAYTPPKLRGAIPTPGSVAGNRTWSDAASSGISRAGEPEPRSNRRRVRETGGTREDSGRHR